ncbi:MAG: 3-oxoacid CoA-transferase subunit A [Spirochaetales bacterium]|uniref:3-oxoacid CoA-transferase subunit A n=1 Tax=Candidatus Thalassospirochaeta sargassi TaxID=3119039 RepID=A0AAJ1II43_9SPIO|nr:3-oxoacid CoA-transferase subunit A [Spirochaetales bacterium]
MIEKEIITCEAAAELVKPGQVVMVGGFMGCGSPPELLASLKAAGTKDMTLVCNDCGWYIPAKDMINGVAINVEDKQFSKVITSHIGLNSEIQRQMLEGETEVQLVPQGTLAEQIRAAGCGLGGFLTPTGVGTEVEDGKQVIEYEGRKYLLEHPLKGDVALLHASVADKAGNLMYARSARNFGPLMAMACETVIVQADEIVEIGEMDPECVVTPSIFVNYLVKTENKEGK